ncbi:dTMP kinase [Tessaracoccus antarcticus]|uniref:Thymidylate kinase n=1 Tax=Tessaracoccus antarcticus TaxID=2479848 RepID=A0A3M0GA93_9ACTN|nr:dTMP kinase [Tessaracoccus antarcticus]RMB61197.1 dTMP kinase [Tessaracoccus antarcticus]
MSGVFIVFEGGDGVGKSTQVAMLASLLASRGVHHTVTRQPGGTPLGAKLRRLILDHGHGDVAPRTEALMYAADKAQHVYEVVAPALERGEVVVCDRYVDSMIAYQGAGRSLGLDEVALVAGWATGGLLPDLTVLLDADPADAVEQISIKDRLESAGVDFHRRARAHLLHLASKDPERYLILDARRSREDLADAIAARVAEVTGR